MVYMADNTKPKGASVQNAEVDLLSPDCWEIAAGYSKPITDIPSSFSSVIRQLKKIEVKPGGEPLDDTTRFLVMRLMKSPTLKAPIYFAALSIYKDAIQDPTKVSDSDLLNLFSPSDLSTMFGLVYSYKRVTQKCDAKEWEILSKMLKIDMEVGTYLGYAIPRVGLGNGMILGAIRYLAMGLIAAHDLKGFKGYRRECKLKNIPYNPIEEVKNWGCTHLHIASKLLQCLGFGISAATGLSIGLLSPGGAVDNDEDAYRWKIAGLWIESLRKSGTPPDITHRGEYYPKKADMDMLLSEIGRINADATGFDWIDKTKEDLDALIKGGVKTKTAAPVAGEDIDQEIMEELSESGQ